MVNAGSGARTLKRKLTTIFCADAQRFSALMAADEDATLARLKRYRAIMGRLFERHDGRQVNTWGDAVISEFSSVVEAVRCAVEIQDAVTAENADLPEASQMWFRIGINLGDVMHDNGDLYGDGVNVAARLESLAEPGGILVSETVYTLAHKQLAVGFDFAGKQQVKGIDESVPVYAVRTTGRNEPDAAPQGEPEDHAPGGQDAENRHTEGRKRAGPASRSVLSRTAASAEGALAWLAKQPKRVRLSAGLIGVFAGLNLLFTGIADPWFIFPSAPFALYIYLHYRRDKAGRMR
jgi:adenylate cyclase